jgi:23S rRNA (cytidine1920-2'-O)/16S rRNA (cytidine1409-2'-O)-methyltransferase
MKVRIDQLLVNRNLFDSKKKAQSAIISGIVKVENKIIYKPGTLIDEKKEIIITKELSKYVSRGGIKLEKAIIEFSLEIKDKIFLDIGASTGGFTDCLLKNGAKKVYAIDVGYGQLDWSLRNNEKVVVFEKTNARYLKPQDLYKNEKEKANGSVIDVSFISLEKIIPNIVNLLDKDFFIVALIKPQFEAGREKVKKGIVINEQVHKEVITKFVDFVNSLNLKLLGITFSPIKGPSGNIEFLAYISNKGENKTFDIDKLINLSYENLNKNN